MEINHLHQTVVFRTSFKIEHGVLLNFLNFLNNAVKGLLRKWLKCWDNNFYDKNGKIVDLIGLTGIFWKMECK